MTQTYNVYCDESTHLPNDKCPYMVLAYIGIPYREIKLIKELVKNLKKKYDFTGEFKWTNVHDATFPMYSELIDYFFSTNMQFRAVIVKKSMIDESRPDYSYNDFYFRMYYQLLHHLNDPENNYNVYFDIKDTCSHQKLNTLKEILKWNTAIKNFQFIRSHESMFVQIADVLMGAVNYNLRRISGNIEGTVIAKQKIIEKVKRLTNISLETTTPLSNNKFNLFFISLQ